MSDDLGGLLPRDGLQTAMFAAWLNVRQDQIPPENLYHTCMATQEAWGRVANDDALEAAEDDADDWRREVSHMRGWMR